jgi:hypothetical protein
MLNCMISDIDYLQIVIVSRVLIEVTVADRCQSRSYSCLISLDPPYCILYTTGVHTRKNCVSDISEGHSFPPCMSGVATDSTIAL